MDSMTTKNNANKQQQCTCEKAPITFCFGGIIHFGKRICLEYWFLLSFVYTICYIKRMMETWSRKRLRGKHWKKYIRIKCNFLGNPKFNNIHAPILLETKINRQRPRNSNIHTFPHIELFEGKWYLGSGPITLCVGYYLLFLIPHVWAVNYFYFWSITRLLFVD